MSLEERIILTASELLGEEKVDEGTRVSIQTCLRLARDIFCENTLQGIAPDMWLAIILEAIKSRNLEQTLPKLVLEQTLNQTKRPVLRAVS